MSRYAATVLLLALSACAQVREPVGGPKDETPPQLVSAEPPSGTTGFAGGALILRFDERIDLRKVRENVVVSPPLETPLEVTRTGPREVRIDLPGPLLAGTTYVINLGQAVVDLTEGNAAKDLVHVVATGDAVDSLEVAGTVRHAYTGAVERDVAVLLYEAGDTAAFTAGRPRYIARTDAEGRFRLRYLAGGRYNLRALRDLNGNLRYDLPGEEIAFDPAEVALPGDTIRHTLELYREPGPRPQVMDDRVLPEGALQLVFSKPVDSLAVRTPADGPRPAWLLEWGSDRDTVLAWPTDTTLLHGVRVIVQADSAAADTVTYRRPLRPPFHLVLRAGAPTPVGVPLRSSRPIDRVDAERVVAIGPGADSVRFAVDRDTTDRRLLWVRHQGGDRGPILLRPKAVHDVFGAWNDSTTVTLGAFDPGTVGSLKLTIDGPGGSLIALLQDGQGRAVRRAVLQGGTRTVLWGGLSPGTYSIRAVRDANANGRWDPGRWREGLLPEVVLTHPEPVQVRLGWDLEITWTLP
ncbi:MAG: Ig-like domain-containing protein [Flavobacteriales bacterium]|nr:hypothetical protein [Flavobacteriales bacterium]MCC6577236.1 Ig-like domain-containing protein [Flavobacteriales bacterium]NUQ14193.1 Ig-like domain-containing protein [Flavobacteriales bacterium]